MCLFKLLTTQTSNTSKSIIGKFVVEQCVFPAYIVSSFRSIFMERQSYAQSIGLITLKVII